MPYCNHKECITRLVGANRFIIQFDQAVYQEKIESIHLVNTEAKMIADLLNEYILKIGSTEPINKLHTLDNRKLSENQLFAKGTKVIPIQIKHKH